MKDAVVALFALLALTAAVSLGFFYWQFRSWPPHLWAKQAIRRRTGCTWGVWAGNAPAVAGAGGGWFGG